MGMSEGFPPPPVRQGTGVGAVVKLVICLAVIGFSVWGIIYGLQGWHLH